MQVKYKLTREKKLNSFLKHFSNVEHIYQVSEYLQVLFYVITLFIKLRPCVNVKRNFFGCTFISGSIQSNGRT